MTSSVRTWYYCSFTAYKQQLHCCTCTALRYRASYADKLVRQSCPAAAHRYSWLPRCCHQLLLCSQEGHADQRLLCQPPPAVQPHTTDSIKTIHVCLQAAAEAAAEAPAEAAAEAAATFDTAKRTAGSTLLQAATPFAVSCSPSATASHASNNKKCCSSSVLTLC
jgi:hypothetical protein